MLDSMVQKIYIFDLHHMKGDGASITFCQIIWHQACYIFILLEPKVVIAKTYFLHYYIWVKTLCTIL